ncbi:hypothetical protein GSI_05111 [Ganoderma sinense ZZ0214-1]|uniref:Aminoglycoside phosphotransferase domain-containing protein n=1 Tax=Ganoderma sinense ZZ0214-1 TaxID=1077348 RepID=A0A2G8SGV7_9APHY|nr:hypothetical protein GSI_05111 [Ganoderma sinense ZZ0214-1]
MADHNQPTKQNNMDTDPFPHIGYPIQLPQEVLDLVLNDVSDRHLDRIGTLGNLDTLRACALVTKKAWRLRAQRRTFLRCIPSHDDLNETNVPLVSSNGHITGIIDWEYHSVLPVVLAAEYPRYLRYDGIYDPRFTLEENGWWTARPEDAAKLRAIYAEAVKAQNEDYWRALIDGELLRQCYE